MLRGYQNKIIEDVRQAWDAGFYFVGMQLPTGAGKTVIFCHLLAEETGKSMVIAHRNQILAQTSLCLAKNGVAHDIIAPKSVIKVIVEVHRLHLGKSFFKPNARVCVAGVDTLIKRDGASFKDVKLVVVDEAHHVLRANKWGKALELFPNARGLFPTATPKRSDSKGLGAEASGVIETLIVGEPMKSLIEQGFLADYDVLMQKANIDFNALKTGANGDFTQKSLSLASQKSHIVGDVVAHYKKHAMGKLGLTFCTDLVTAADLVKVYKAEGVPAALVSAQTSEIERARIMKDFEAGKLLNLVSVDVLGEGVDVPAVEVVSLARPTKSYALFCQQIGRGLRPKDGKKALIIDHVGNALRHGRPESGMIWSLKDEKRAKQELGGTEAIQVCEKCFYTFKRYQTKCPYCGAKKTAVARSTPESVDGDLSLVDHTILRVLRAKIADILDNYPIAPAGLPKIAKLGYLARHRERRIAHEQLHVEMFKWAKNQEGLDNSEKEKLFFLTFGIDVLTAHTLSRREADELSEKIRERNRYYSAVETRGREEGRAAVA